ncbi:MAG: 6-phospho-3-hexuloisomerase [archaeon GB-1867-097]|nr:6-phospho-3-hexuloisomerase [Candidatus Culexmicrobium thermophilum]MCS7384172.1 6-phospho-3-hexuloisomerase [Candidatus Culexmicrobium thermophilum]HDO20504.1 6-phospho-3-hexuloisomerase [Candidatus Bathyarchaeota archaeon]
MTLATVKECLNQISTFINKLPSLLDFEQVEKMINMLIYAQAANRSIFVVGAGRSGLIAKAFAMRLMHLGFHVYVIGETITPAAGKGDVLVAISGSGRTGIVVTVAQVAKQVGVKVVAVTSHPDSPLGKLSDHVVFVPGRTKISDETDYFSRQILGIHEPLAPLGTLFEIAAMVFLESIVTELMHRLGKTEEDLRARHATIEVP